jgi:FMN phosphatase YigB (HAD superfamily)
MVMLIFDFDGVLINSIDEVTLTVYNAATGKLVTDLAALPKALVRLFQRNRFHVQPIGDAILLMNWCVDNYRGAAEKILTRQEFGTIISGTEIEVSQRTHAIYSMRKRFIDQDPSTWMGLHQPYQPIWNELLRYPKQPFVILTNKNRDATLRLCRCFGLNAKETDIYSGDHGVTKVENMKQIQQRFRSDIYYFIDDSVKNLQELDAHLDSARKNLVLLFASWGYTGPDDPAIAREAGYAVFKQTDLISLLAQQRAVQGVI